MALIIAAAGLFVRAYMRLAERARDRDGRAEPLPQGRPSLHVRPIPTVLIGAVGGLVVGLTSVGSGSLIIIALMMLYPRLKASELVGTDLVQAVPLVAAAAFGHILYGDFQPRADRVPARRAASPAPISAHGCRPRCPAGSSGGPWPSSCSRRR